MLIIIIIIIIYIIYIYITLTNEHLQLLHDGGATNFFKVVPGRKRGALTMYHYNIRCQLLPKVRQISHPLKLDINIVMVMFALRLPPNTQSPLFVHEVSTLRRAIAEAGRKH